MKRSERGRTTIHAVQKRGGLGFRFLLLLLAVVGGYLYYQHMKDEKIPVPEESSVVEHPETELPPMKEMTEPVNQQPENTMPVETVYRIYDGLMETSEGTYSIIESPKVYTPNGQVEWENLNSFIGMKGISLELDKEQRVTGIHVDREVIAPQYLRILLASEKNGYLHEAPEITCSAAYRVIIGETVKEQDKDTVYIPDAEETSRILLQGDTSDAIWKVGDGMYRGNLELIKDGSGWYIINEVDLESYLYSVVPSEMPDSYGMEAAKVQAVCSRSYAYTQWRDSQIYAEYGAHMDNTVNCQVYGKAAETAHAVEGVDATRGQVLVYDGEVVTAYFFSTSCGMTADAGDVWGNGLTQEYPTATPGYLKGQAQYLDAKEMDLREESAFYEFITDTQIPGYDQESPWYRWSTVISTDGLLDAMMPVILEISSSRPYLVQTLAGDRFVTQTVSSIGSLKNIYVYSRGRSGIITGLLIEGSESTLLIRGENSIRRVLAAGSVMVELKDGSQRDDQMMLPSAFFSIEKGVDTEGNLLQLTLRGGGYGHGVGMSQMGVKGMLNSGFTWDEILKHYYNGIEIADLSEIGIVQN